MSIYYKYAPYGKNVVVLYYFDDCVYWYNYEALVKLCLDHLGKILHVNFLGYAHWFMSIIIYHMEDHSIYVDQARYATSTWIMPQLRQVQMFIRSLFHML